MKSVSVCEQEQGACPSYWDFVASTTCRPIKYTFGILKERFRILGNRLSLHQEDDCVYVKNACILLRNMCIDDYFIRRNETFKISWKMRPTLLQRRVQQRICQMLYFIILFISKTQFVLFTIAINVFAICCLMLLLFRIASISSSCLFPFYCMNSCMSVVWVVFARLRVIIILSSSVPFLVKENIERGSYRALELIV